MQVHRRAVVPVLVALSTVAVSLLCAYEIRKEQLQRLVAEIEAHGTVFATKLEERVASRLDVALLMRDALVNRTGDLDATFMAFAQTLHDRKQEIQAINWVGPDGIIRIVTPLNQNRPALGLDITSLQTPSETLRQALENKSLRVSPPITLAQGGRGFVGYLPIFDETDLLGYVNVVFRTAPLIESVSESFGSKRIDISIFDDQALIWKAISAKQAEQFTTRVPIEVGGRAWIIEVSPTQLSISLSESTLDELVVVFGTLIALILAISIHAVDKNRTKLIDREERFDLAMKGATDGIFDWNAETGETYFSPRWFQMLGYEPGELEASLSTFLSLLHPDDEPRIRSNRTDGASPDECAEEEFRMRHKDGRWIYIMSRATVQKTGGSIKRIVGTHVDITVLRQQQKELEVAAKTDELTGLRNRRDLQKDLLTCTQSLRHCERLVIFHVDLDMFKAVNDTRGHHAGDYALKITAQRLLADPAEFDVIARVGGDEFLIAKRFSGTAGKLQKIANETISRISEPFSYQTSSLRIGASIGIALLDGETETSISLAVTNADIALKASKLLGRGRSFVFSKGMEKEALYAANLSIEIEEALRHDEFFAYFQPQLNLSTGTVIGLEALARWHHPARGLLKAGEFVPYAENSNLMKAVDESILKHVCCLAQRLPDLGLAGIDISINLSTSQLMDPDIVSAFIKRIRERSLSASIFRIEILETTLLSERNTIVAENIRRFADLGVRMDLDDFGTGHAAILNLLNFPISRVKLDRSLAANIQNDPRRQKVTKAILEMCEGLAVEVLAEGIESKEELQCLHAMGCWYAQGYYLSPPLPWNDLSNVALPVRHSQTALSA